MIGDPIQMLQAAHAAFLNGRLDKARHDIDRLLAAFPAMDAAQHLLGLVEKARGNYEQSERAFRAALSLAPNNPETLTNYANLLNDLGRHETALQHYRRAIGLRPDFANAHLNLGIVAQRLNLFEEAERALGRATQLMPQQSKAWTALGLLHLAQGKQEDAQEALDRAIALEPANIRAHLARAQLELDRREPAAALGLFQRARKAIGDNPRIDLGEAVARQQLGEHGSALELLERAVEADPANIEAHGQLARLRWESGVQEPFAGYATALEARPTDVALWFSYLNMLGTAGRHQAVIDNAAAARRAAGERPEFDLMEADAASELGDRQRADFLFSKLSSSADPNVAIRQGRHLLRYRRPDEAAAILEPLAAAGNAPLAWAYLATAWRLMADPRWEWLEGDPRLVGVIDLEDLSGTLPALAEELRTLHLTRIHPFDQTLRGGTQTRGSLLKLQTPAIRKLRASIEDAVRRFIDSLPSQDPAHPLLSQPRGGFRFAGSWSVSLRAHGFHINHVHPEGWISSAFYVSLPPASAGSTAGWLALGEPPSELGLDLEPFRLVEPKPGRLVLFPSTMWHGTRPFDKGERLTVAFDVAPLRSA